MAHYREGPLEEYAWFKYFKVEMVKMVGYRLFQPNLLEILNFIKLHFMM
jgi:hypothetical protein